ncbi:hypothetical protein [Halalkalibacter alkalisediminis]|uniref:Uncharacterized protein n=1 Tax=Halalkalibacter alkalisediminis TaxID=935616 RepID=A0ABV6NHS9_9BACI|nr:hypothetical protein [Halalkalibacter alkalisediminis]
MVALVEAKMKKVVGFVSGFMGSPIEFNFTIEAGTEEQERERAMNYLFDLQEEMITSYRIMMSKFTDVKLMDVPELKIDRVDILEMDEELVL